jgi:hypothetical protein
MFIDAPLFLVSQIPRSGGSMLAQLFDGHPQVYAHPAEIHAQEAIAAEALPLYESLTELLAPTSTGSKG